MPVIANMVENPIDRQWDTTSGTARFGGTWHAPAPRIHLHGRLNMENQISPI